MSDDPRLCPRCGSAMEGRSFCPSCGAGSPEPPAYLLGGGLADSIVAIVAGLLPMVLAWLGLALWSMERPWASALIYAGIGLLVLEIVAFFTLLRPYRTARQTLAVTFGFYTVPGAAVSACFSLVNPSSALPLLLAAVLLLLFQGVVIWMAFRRR